MNDMETRIKEAFEDKIGPILARVDAVEEENARLRDSNRDLEKRLHILERSARTNNVVFSGFKFDSPQEGYAKMHEYVQKATGGKVKVSGIRAVKTHNTTKIIAACPNIQDKRLIMGLKKTLKDEKDSTKRIYIDDDLTKTDQQMQASLRKMAKDLANEGKVVKVEFGRLRVNGELMYFNMDSQKLEMQRFRRNETRNVECAGAQKEVKGTGGVSQ